MDDPGKHLAAAPFRGAERRERREGLCPEHAPPAHLARTCRRIARGYEGLKHVRKREQRIAQRGVRAAPRAAPRGDELAEVARQRAREQQVREQAEPNAADGQRTLRGMEEALEKGVAVRARLERVVFKC